MARTILLTGPPGVGKTTIIQQVVARLPGRAGGFYTAEIREHGERVGFRLVTLDGEEGFLAHVANRSPYRVGRYGVDLADLERVGVAAIRQAIAARDVVVIDEIGKMELFSAAFRAAVQEAVDSPKPVLGTITFRPHPWADGLKRHPHVQLLVVTLANRHALAERVVGFVGGEAFASENCGPA